MFVRTITSKRLNVGRSNLAVRYSVQKSHPSSKVKVKCQGHQGQKTAKSSPLAVHSSLQHASTGDTIACRPGMTGYADGKISACCLVGVNASCSVQCFDSRKEIWPIKAPFR